MSMILFHAKFAKSMIKTWAFCVEAGVAKIIFYFY